jgi:lipid-binding SYLF domain-containing protein
MTRFSIRRWGVVLGLLVLGLARAGHASDANLITEAQKTVALYQRTDPGLAAFLRSSAGYAVFPKVTKGAVGIGGAHGTGVVFERGGMPIGKATLTQVTVGAQLGGQEYSQIIFFQTPGVLADFKSGQMSFAAQASAVALRSGASANAKYQNGVAIFTATTGGLMAEASVGGQKFSFEPFAPHR